MKRLDKSYKIDRVDYTKGYVACYMDVVNESKVIHNVINDAFSNIDPKAKERIKILTDEIEKTK